MEILFERKDGPLEISKLSLSAQQTFAITQEQVGEVYIQKIILVRPNIPYNLNTAKGVRDLQAFLQSKITAGNTVGFYFEFATNTLTITTDASVPLNKFSTIQEG